MFVSEEIESQPALWQRAAELARAKADTLPKAGSRTALFGCGTSLFVAQAVAASREAAGAGETGRLRGVGDATRSPVRLGGSAFALRYDDRGLGAHTASSRIDARAGGHRSAG